MKSILLFIALPIVFFLLIWILGPRYVLAETPKTLPELPDDLDQFVKRNENQFPELKKGVEKEIIWAGETNVKTDYAIVYLHGFSSSRKELSPVVEETAKELKSNLFFTRFKGHGSQDGELLNSVDRDDWLEDTLEAVAIGKKIGKKVILIGTSHGGLLACWAASQPDLWGIDALIAISPNFGPRDPRTKLLKTPWAKQILPKLFGSHRYWTPQNSGHDYYWNTKYPSHALFPMMAQVNYITPRAPHSIQCPTLFLYSTNDNTVNPEYIKKAFSLIPATNKKFALINDSTDKDQHIIAGDILSPDTTVKAQQIITEFIKNLNSSPNSNI